MTQAAMPAPFVKAARIALSVVSLVFLLAPTADAQVTYYYTGPTVSGSITLTQPLPANQTWACVGLPPCTGRTSDGLVIPVTSYSFTGPYGTISSAASPPFFFLILTTDSGGNIIAWQSGMTYELFEMLTNSQPEILGIPPCPPAWNSDTIGPADEISVEFISLSPPVCADVTSATPGKWSQSLTITTTSIPDATYNAPTLFAAYGTSPASDTFQFQASGGTPPYTWTVSVDITSPPTSEVCAFGQACFPPGLQFDGSTGTISANPSTDLVSGTYNLTAVTVTDSAGASYTCPNSSTCPTPFTLTVSCGSDGELDTLTNLYRTYPAYNKGVPLLTYVANGAQFIPPCSSFTQTAQAPSSLGSFIQSGEAASQVSLGISNPWALVRSPLTIPAALLPAGYGLATWVTVFNQTTTAQGKNYGARTISGGYRDPVYNASLSASSSSNNSRHMFGDAVDLHNASYIVGSPGTNGSCGGQQAALDELNAMLATAKLAGAGYVEPPNIAAYCHAHADWKNKGGAFQ